MKYTIRFGNTTNEDYDSIKVVSDYDETKVTPCQELSLRGAKKVTEP